MSRFDGGPAFPLGRDEDLNPATDFVGHDISSGMSLRDWFAGQALVGMGTWCPVPGATNGSRGWHEVRSIYAYGAADAMLAARAAAKWSE